MAITVRIITPDRVVWNKSVDEVVLPSTTGQLGILSEHAPLITALEIGVLRFKVDNNWYPIILFGGFAEVENNQLTVLVNGVEETIVNDMESAKKELEEASVKLEAATTEREKFAASQNLKKIAARVQAMTFL